MALNNSVYETITSCDNNQSWKLTTTVVSF